MHDLSDCHVHGVYGDSEYVEGEKDEELLVLLAHTVVDPGTVVVHLPYTPPTHLHGGGWSQRYMTGRGRGEARGCTF